MDLTASVVVVCLAIAAVALPIAGTVPQPFATASFRTLLIVSLATGGLVAAGWMVAPPALKAILPATWAVLAVQLWTYAVLARYCVEQRGVLPVFTLLPRSEPLTGLQRVVAAVLVVLSLAGTALLLRLVRAL